ncbi:MAG: FAD-dependent oxidoreductase [Dehalococcoidales bacterium]|nr:FAD-dependent oxidoreductase [Dehalococcoidales bacterium]
MYDVMIVGGGPAGLSAAVYTARKRLKTLLVSIDIGGQINTTRSIENYLGYQFIEGPELIDKFNAQINKYPIEQKIGPRVTRLEKSGDGFWAITEEGVKYLSKAVVFAAGKKPKKLDVPGEAEFTGRGVSYCAICDGPIFAGQRVAVVGGGNSALEAVLDLVNIAEHVNLVSQTALTGDPVLIAQLKGGQNLDIYLEHRVEEIDGQDFVAGVVIKDVKSGKVKKLDVTGVFIEIGMVPNSEPVKDIVELNELAEIPVDRSCETGVPGLYAAGDVTDVPEKQIVVAAGEGAKAALEAHRYLQRLGALGTA